MSHQKLCQIQCCLFTIIFLTKLIFLPKRRREAIAAENHKYYPKETKNWTCNYQQHVLSGNKNPYQPSKPVIFLTICLKNVKLRLANISQN